MASSRHISRPPCAQYDDDDHHMEMVFRRRIAEELDDLYEGDEETDSEESDDGLQKDGEDEA